MLASLHWLPVRFRTDFKILLITSKAPLSFASSSIEEMLIAHDHVCCLRSSVALLAVPKSRLESKGDCAFAIRAPRLWNDLPEEIRPAESVTSVKSSLKTHFYRLAFMWSHFLHPLKFFCIGIYIYYFYFIFAIFNLYLLLISLMWCRPRIFLKVSILFHYFYSSFYIFILF